MLSGRMDALVVLSIDGRGRHQAILVQ